MIPEDRRSLFPEDFCDALESWFTADIACCDACRDEFVAIWPHAYAADNAEFQRISIPLDVFYKSSQLADMYTREEFDELIKDMYCPRCGSDLDGNMWPYTFPFDVDPEIEDTIQEIADIATATPFLLLTHPFAKQVYDLLVTIGRTVSPTQFDKPLYRGRRDRGDVAETISEFDVPPCGDVKEGRYNHAGNPVLYLASDQETCFEEMHREPCVVAELTFHKGLKVLDLIDPFTSHRQVADELSTLVYSTLMSAKQDDDGWHKPAYVFSRFIADCAKASGLQAIKYPSTRITACNFNLAVIERGVSLSGNGKVNAYSHLAT